MKKTLTFLLILMVVMLTGCNDGKFIENRYVSEKFTCSIEGLPGWTHEHIEHGAKYLKNSDQALNFYHFNTEATKVEDFHEEYFPQITEFAVPHDVKTQKVKLGKYKGLATTFIGNEAYESMRYKVYTILQPPRGYLFMYYYTCMTPTKETNQLISDMERICKSFNITEGF